MPSLKLRIVFAVAARDELLPPVAALVEGLGASAFLTPNQLLMFAVIQTKKYFCSFENLSCACPRKAIERSVMEVSGSIN